MYFVGCLELASRIGKLRVLTILTDFMCLELLNRVCSYMEMSLDHAFEHTRRF